MLTICALELVETGRHLYIAICYFMPSTSNYASPRGNSPYTILDEDIWECSRDGDIISLGAFVAQPTHHQASFFDTSEEMLGEVDTRELGLGRNSPGLGVPKIWQVPLRHGTAHGLAILNGLERYPLVDRFTCLQIPP